MITPALGAMDGTFGSRENDVTVIVCTYNRSGTLRQALESLVGQKVPRSLSCEILVVDDGSTDNTKTIVEEMTAQPHVSIRYVLAEGKGIASARNRGLRESSSEWVVFFDDDQLAKPGWLTELFACARDANSICVGGRVVLDLPEEQLAQLTQTVRNLLGETDKGMARKRCARKEFPGCGNLLLKRNVFDALGEFDESLSLGGEDTELAQRMRKAGVIAWYTPTAVVSHMIPPYRLREEYLVWTSQRVGDNFAHRDYLEWGLARTILACIARIVKAIVITLPTAVWQWLKADDAQLLSQKCLFWRAAGYTVRTLHLLIPRFFNPEQFLNRLEFRKERGLFSSDSNATEGATGHL